MTRREHVDFNLSPSPTTNLVGRERELKLLDDCARCLVYGMPEIGKTSLAAKPGLSLRVLRDARS